MQTLLVAKTFKLNSCLCLKIQEDMVCKAATRERMFRWLNIRMPSKASEDLWHNLFISKTSTFLADLTSFSGKQWVGTPMQQVWKSRLNLDYQRIKNGIIGPKN